MKDRIHSDIKVAMKARNRVRLTTLRMILADLQHKEKEDHSPVDNKTAVQILQSMTRKRKEAIEQFRKGKREDLVEKELAEIKIIAEYLPQQMSEEEIKKNVLHVIDEHGATSLRETGKIMGAIMKELAGKADGTLINRIVKQELQKLESK